MRKSILNLSRLFHTVRFLKPVQIYGRLWFKLYRPDPILSSVPGIRRIEVNWVCPCRKNPSLVFPYRFNLLNITRLLKSKDDWNNPGWEKLWLYNLHYFDDLQACDAEDKSALHVNLIEKWIRENPPATGNGWEPYPISLRVVNLIKWAFDGNNLSYDALRSLAVQTRYLFKRLEFHLLGNHLLANAKALVFAGLFFKGKEADKWLNKGIQILKVQLSEQILSDGGHFELSPMYHSVVLEDLLDIINIMRAYNQPPVDEWSGFVLKMFYWLEVMCHPDKRISFFNDTAFGIASEPSALKDYAGRLGFNIENPLIDKISILDKSGFIRLQKADTVLLADVGRIGPDYLPGHAHADTLSFELSIKGKRVFVNSGISCYGDSTERLLQRSTAAHNTMMIDGMNSSEIWGGFRVARRAYPLKAEAAEITDKGLYIRCGHNGYTRLKGKPVHYREWLLLEDSLEVRDKITGNFSEALIFYHLHPEFRVDLHLKRIYSKMFSVSYETDADVSIERKFYYPEFGISVPDECLVVKPSGNECFVKFKWC